MCGGRVHDRRRYARAPKTSCDILVMKTWILLAALGLLLWYVFSYREHLTEPPAPKCPAGATIVGINCVDSSGTLSSPCPSGFSYSDNKCVSVTSESIDTEADGPAKTCNKYWTAAIASWATASPAASPYTPACIGYAPSWVSTLIVSNTLLNADKTPTQATITQSVADVAKKASYANEQAISSSYAKNSGYAGLLNAAKDADNGALPPPVNETQAPTDVPARSTTGPVFGDNGPFSGQPGIGQGTGASAAAAMKGSVYSPPPGQTASVKGPSWGGLGTPSASSSSAASSAPAPLMYGPNTAARQKPNSQNTSALPPTPGTHEMELAPYMQAMTYSLANGSQKTDPVPYLTDFSTFQR